MCGAEAQVYQVRRLQALTVRPQLSALTIHIIDDFLFALRATRKILFSLQAYWPRNTQYFSHLLFSEYKCVDQDMAVIFTENAHPPIY